MCGKYYFSVAHLATSESNLPLKGQGPGQGQGLHFIHHDKHLPNSLQGMIGQHSLANNSTTSISKQNHQQTTQSSSSNVPVNFQLYKLSSSILTNDPYQFLLWLSNIYGP